MNTKKKFAINQPRKELGLRRFLLYFSTKHVGIYTVLRFVLKQKHGLELEREYSSVFEGYTYVFYVSCTVLVRVLNALYAGLAGGYSTNAVEYGTGLYCIIYFNVRYYTAFRDMAKPNIAAVAYRTRTVCNTE